MLKITVNLYLTLIFQVTLCPWRRGGRGGQARQAERLWRITVHQLVSLGIWEKTTGTRQTSHDYERVIFTSSEQG